MSDESDEEKWIAEWARRQAEDTFRRIFDRGLPEKFKVLFGFTKKSDVVKFCRTLEIKKGDLTDLILHCEGLGFEHQDVHLRIAPKDIQITEEETKAFQENGVGPFKDKKAKKFFTKMEQIHQKTKSVHGHLFLGPNAWHLIFFSPDDAMPEHKNLESHWVNGPHLHYVSHLWGFNVETVWSRLQNPPYKIDSEHIRYFDS